MKYRQLGKTNLNVSVIGLGGASLGGVYQYSNEETAIHTVHQALDKGINFIDTSPYYGLTKSETVLGKAIAHYSKPRSNYYIATKVGRYDKNNFDFSEKRVTMSVHESISRLQTDYIDLIQCHDIEFGDLDQIVTETLPALHRLKEKGIVKYIGITGFPLKIFTEVLDRLDKLDDQEGIKVDSILTYCHYSLNNTSLERIIPILKDHNVGIINAGALSMGLLTRQGPPEWHPATKEIKETCRAAVQHALARGEYIERLALEYSLSKDDIQTTLVGTASLEEVTKNIIWTEEFLKHGFSDTVTLDEVRNILKPISNKTWSSGRPENDDQ